MNHTKKIILLLSYIFLQTQYSFIDASQIEVTEPMTSETVQTEHLNTQEILQKLDAINNKDSENLNAVQDISYSLLFNNFVNFKNYIVNNFSKTKIQKLCKELIDQIYPEDESDVIDFGTAIVAPQSTSTVSTTESSPLSTDTSKQESGTTETTSIAMNENQSNDGISLANTAPTEQITTEITETVSTEPEGTPSEPEQQVSNPSEPE